MADEPPDTINESIDQLRERLRVETEARLAAEGRAQNAEQSARRVSQEADRRGNEIQQSRMQVIDSELEQIKTQRDIMKARLRSASAEGDHEAVAEITAEIGDAAARLLQMENGKYRLQYEIDNPPQARPTGDTRPFNQLSLAERVTRIANGLSPQSAAWVRAHPEWAHSEEKVNALIGAHNAAIARGKTADTPGYFADIERMLEISEPGARNGADQGADALSEAARPARDTPPPSAPARSSNSGRVRTLSAQEREAAKIAGQTDQEYADAQDALVKEGRITRH